MNLAYETERQEKLVICCTEWQCAWATQNGCGTLANNQKSVKFFHTCDPSTTLNLDQKRKFVPFLPLLCKLTKCHLNYSHFANLHTNVEWLTFSLDSYMSHLITFNCTKVRPLSDFFTGFHSSLMFCIFCACAKDQFLIKTQFYDLVRFISIDSIFVPNLERIG